MICEKLCKRYNYIVGYNVFFFVSDAYPKTARKVEDDIKNVILDEISILFYIILIIIIMAEEENKEFEEFLEWKAEKKRKEEENKVKQKEAERQVKVNTQMSRVSS